MSDGSPRDAGETTPEVPQEAAPKGPRVSRRALLLVVPALIAVLVFAGVSALLWRRADPRPAAVAFYAAAARGDADGAAAQVDTRGAGMPATPAEVLRRLHAAEATAALTGATYAVGDARVAGRTAFVRTTVTVGDSATVFNTVLVKRRTLWKVDLTRTLKELSTAQP